MNDYKVIGATTDGFGAAPYRADAAWIGALTDAERGRLDALERDIADLRRWLIAWCIGTFFISMLGMLT